MAKFSDIKGFVFDLDGVITDTSVFHSQAWHQVADKVGAPWSKELEDGIFELRIKQSNNITRILYFLLYVFYAMAIY